MEKKLRGIKGKDDAYQTKDNEALTGQAVNKTYLRHEQVERLESPSNQTKKDLKTLSYRQKEVNDYNLMNEKN